MVKTSAEFGGILGGDPRSPYASSEGMYSSYLSPVLNHYLSFGECGGNKKCFHCKDESNIVLLSYIPSTMSCIASVQPFIT